MMVTFISQCEKNALKKTRRVLDAFANRIGDNTWQTVITEDGLSTVKKMLRQTASKSTAVSCHWIRSRSRSQFLWVVGNKSKFNSEGVVAVNRTKRNLLTADEQHDWNYLPLIQALAGLAALLHDWGKATALFQQKLASSKQKMLGDPVRHEWISLLLFQAFVQSANSVSMENDEPWLQKLSAGDIDENHLKKIVLESDIKPFKKLPPLAQLVAWLIVSHHRLPLPEKELCAEYKGELLDSISKVLSQITMHWGYQNTRRETEKENLYKQRLNLCFTFPKGILSQSTRWLRETQKWANKLSHETNNALQTINDGSYRLILHHARLSLMLGDHFYSSLDVDDKRRLTSDAKWKGSSTLFANTDKKTRALKQTLDEHLMGVARYALRSAYLLPAFETEPSTADDVESLRRPITDKRFKWQDKAVISISDWREAYERSDKRKYGFFAVNMASTGSGKTFANAKIMRALSGDAQSLRFVLALGLRTLTLQTGDEYRERIGLNESQLAVMIGSKAVMELHQDRVQLSNSNSFEHSGSESQEPLLKDDFESNCDIPDDHLATVLPDEKSRKFLYAPVLTCTIDHLMSATETKRGGRFILPTLRLMSSDLVIDEIDDFTGDDLIAIGRLIHLAGMLGRKVMISSATIPPFMAEGYFKAYRDGWRLYCKTRGASNAIGCAWIDDFKTQVNTNNSDLLCDAILQYRQSHSVYVSNRIEKLKKQVVKRRATIISSEHLIDTVDSKTPLSFECTDGKQDAYFNLVAQSAMNSHKQHNTKDPKSRLKVSFGVVRVANIPPCVALTEYLLNYNWPVNFDARIMAYHSQQVMLLRSEQERHLDEVLKRKEKPGESPKSFNNVVVRDHLERISKDSPDVKNVLFIVVATPVEEVGRDHDFDWAVIEPSSYRSIVQMAGRVQRHRSVEVTKPNVSLLQYNWKAIQNQHKENHKAFCRPGFETAIPLHSHDLRKLVDEKALTKRLDATPRIQMPEHLSANYLRHLLVSEGLAELEHFETWRTLANYKSKAEGDQVGPETLQGWLNFHWHLTALAQQLTPFRNSQKSLHVFLLFDQESNDCRFYEKDQQGVPIDREQVLNIRRIEMSDLQLNKLWLTRDFVSACLSYAQNDEKRSALDVSLRYGELNFIHNETEQYRYNDQLGLVKI
ncbi:type I-F CRISPR-associated helicase Cas3f [Agaribacter flavus]|uniref:Type I-F CRISPR-associated helicase Cas3f n=1 Tax=Agaribacter flavus TaxID=1902781 RepID=A0ABV7FSI3_9ALTE